MDQVHLSEISDLERYKYGFLNLCSASRWHREIPANLFALSRRGGGINVAFVRNLANSGSEFGLYDQGIVSRRGGSRFTIRSIVNPDCSVLPRIFVPRCNRRYRGVIRCRDQLVRNGPRRYYIVTRPVPPTLSRSHLS